MDVPELTEDPDSDYVIIENSETESRELPLDHLTIYDGLLYEERAASTKPIAELQSQLRSRKSSGDPLEPLLSGEYERPEPILSEEYERIRNLRQISRQLETDMRKRAGDSGIDWAAKDKKILSRTNTSREVFGMDDKPEGKPVWKEPAENVKTGTSGGILSEESFEEWRS